MPFSDEPIQPKTFPWRLVLIVGGGVALAISVVAGVWVWTHPAPATPVVVPVTKTVVTTQDTQQEQAPVVPSQQKQDLCENPTDPGIIDRCSDDVIAQQALEGTDLAVCDKIKSEEKKAACKIVLGSDTTIPSCSDTPQVCAQSRVVAVANALSDAEVCIALPSDSFGDCRMNTTVDDPDKDGLTTAEELMIYKTDPRNPDTDNDGYRDGAEVTSGHDPLKK